MKIQKNRFMYLDAARGLAILFMFTQHCMLVHEVDAGEGNDLLANVFLLLGTAPAAPVFMLILGIFLMKSKAGFNQKAFRGVKLIILGFVLNTLRFTIPLSIAGTNNMELLKGETPIDLFFAVDILWLAGLSMIVCSAIKKYATHKFIFPAIMVIVLIVSPFLWGRYDGNVLTAVLWGNDKNVYFPLMPWIIYPMLGMYLSEYLTSNDRLNEHLRKLVIAGLSLIAAGGVLLRFFPIGDYCRSGIAVHLLIIGFMFVWLPACNKMVKGLSESNVIVKTLAFWSKNVTAIYFIQWVIFGWSILIFDANKQSSIVSAVIGLAVLVVTHFLVKIKTVKTVFARV